MKLQISNFKLQILSLAIAAVCSAGFAAEPFAEFIGKKFVILPKPADQKIYGYSCLRRSEGGYIVPTYEECAGMIGTVTKVEAPAHGDTHVHLLIEKNGREYQAVAARDHVPCIAPLEDFLTASKSWQGKTIWLKKNQLLLDTEGNRLREEQRPARFLAAHVDTIIAGYSPSQPVRLVLSQEKNVFCADIRVSDLNVPELTKGPQFSDLFFEQNPREEYPWSDEIWQRIEKGEISTGMNMEQVHLSWGEPTAITKIEGGNCDCVEWEYDETVVHFRDGAVDEVRN